MSRLRGGVAPEALFIQIRDFSDVLVAEFDEADRSGGSGLGWTDLNLNDYEWSPLNDRPAGLDLVVDDPSRALFDEIPEGYKVRAAFGNRMKNVILSYDMELLTAAGTMFDLSLNSHHGTITGATDTIGPFSRARSFDGVANKITVTSTTALELGTKFTLAVTAYFRTLPAGQSGIYRKIAGAPTDGYLLRVSNTGVLNAEIWNAAAQTDYSTAASAIGTATEYRIVFTFDNGTGVLYVDGVSVALTKTGSGTIPGVSGADLLIGDDSGGGNADAIYDNMMIANGEAWTAQQVRDDFDRRGQAPQFYLDGRVISRSHDEGSTQFGCLDGTKEATDIDVFDLIFEGMETDDTTAPRYVLRKTIKYSLGILDGGTDHDELHMKFEDIAGANLPNTARIYSPVKIGYPGQSEWFTQLVNVTSKPLWDDGPSDEQFYFIPFTATAEKINSATFMVNPNGLSGKFDVFVVDNNFNTVFSVIGPTISGTLSIFVNVDLSQASYSLTPGAQYWIGVVPQASPWTQTTPLRWQHNSTAHRTNKRFFNGTFETAISEGFSFCMILHMDGNYVPLSNEEFEVKVSSDGTKLIGDMTNTTTIRSLSGTASLPTVLDDFFEATYFYSTGDKKVSDVIDRLIAKTNLSAVFSQTGGLSSDLLTEKLGLYVPQGGSIFDHLEQLAALTGDRARFLAPSSILFQRWPQPSRIENGSFELTDMAGNFRDWTFVQQVGTGTIQQINTVSAGASGDFHPRMGISGNGQTSAEMRLYQDVENFDPVVSGIDGTNLSFWLHRNQGWTGITFQVSIYDYGSFDNRKIFAITTPALGVWEEKRIKIEREHFRISLELLYSGAALGITQFANFDDVFVHYENLQSFIVLDANHLDTDYNGGLVPGTRTAAHVGVHLMDDIIGLPNIQQETDKRSINYSIQFGRQVSDFGGPPVIAIARNKPRADQIGVRLKISRQESLRDVDDAYKRAKQRLRFEAKFRSSLTLAGQYPHLYGRTIQLFFPDHGIPVLAPVEVTGLNMGPKETEIKIVKSEIEEFVDVEKLKEKEERLSASFDSPDTDTLLYFNTADLPTTVDPADVFQARLKDESGEVSAYKELEQRDTRDGPTVGSVWSWAVGKADGDTFNTAGRASPAVDSDVWTQFEVADNTTPTPVVLATITLSEEFAKLPNEWILIWLYSQ